MLADERRAWLEGLRKERVELLKEADAIRDRSVNGALAGVRSLIDDALRRAASFLALLLAAAATLAVVVYWLTVGHGHGERAPSAA
jgi:hypothetical protein